MQAGLWAGCGAALALALFSGWRDWARVRRRDLDRVGLIDWRSVQLFSLLVGMILASLALNR